MIPPAVLHAAAQQPILPNGRFDAAEFRRAAIREAKAMGLALPAAISEGGQEGH
jgi:hypothetical protein